MRPLRFLRASGGVSALCKERAAKTKFSPRKRRCFSNPGGSLRAECVFSAQAEVFLVCPAAVISGFCFLRASGGVSKSNSSDRRLNEFSPRKRRCFSVKIFGQSPAPVFSAQAEVFLCSTLGH